MQIRPHPLLYPSACCGKDRSPGRYADFDLRCSVHQDAAAIPDSEAAHRRGSSPHFHLDWTSLERVREVRLRSLVHQQPRWVLLGLQPWWASCPTPLNWRGQKWVVVLIDYTQPATRPQPIAWGQISWLECPVDLSWPDLSRPQVIPVDRFRRRAVVRMLSQSNFERGGFGQGQK